MSTILFHSTGSIPDFEWPNKLRKEDPVDPAFMLIRESEQVKIACNVSNSLLTLYFFILPGDPLKQPLTLAYRLT